MTDEEVARLSGAPPAAAKAITLSDEDVAKLSAAAPEPSMLDKYVVQPFKDLGNSVLRANDFAARAITSPFETTNAIAKNPGANLREGMRAVNAGIPFGRTMVEGMGGPAAESPEDAAKAVPGLSDFAGLAGGLVTGKAVGGLVAKGIETAAPVVGKAIGKIGEAAQGRQVDRALSDLEMKTYKRTRAGIRSDVVSDAVAESPELRAAAGNDAKTAKVLDNIRTKATRELEQVYSAGRAPPTKLSPLVSEPANRAAIERSFGGGFDDVTAGRGTVGGKTVASPTSKPVPVLADAVDNFNTRIERLRAEGTATDAAVADRLEKIRDEMSGRLGKRDALNVKNLRAEQSDFQGQAYRKALTADDTLTGKAADEAQRAIGDAVVKHVTGVPYAEAKAMAAADPKGIAARLFKANDQINAVNKIEASIADRAGRVQPREGLAGKLLEVGKKLRHSPAGYAASLVPDAMAGALGKADNALVRIAAPAPAAGRAVAGVTAQFNDQIKAGLAGLAGFGERDQAPTPMTAVRRQRRPLGFQDEEAAY